MGTTTRRGGTSSPVRQRASDSDSDDDHHHRHANQHTEADKLFTEMCGSFVLNLAIALCPNSTIAPLGVVAVIVLICAIGAPISGAHFNPAITGGLHIAGDRTAPSPFKYVVASILAAIAAHASAFMLTGTAPAALESATSDLGWAKICVGEFLGAYFAAIVVMWLVFFSSETSLIAKASCVGLGFFASIVTFSDVSGAVLNPAVSVALCAMGHFTDSHDHSVQHVALAYYLGAQLTGGALAGLTAKAIRDRKTAGGPRTPVRRKARTH